MNISRHKKILIFTVLILLIVTAGIWWLNSSKSSEGNKGSGSEKKVIASACDAFTTEEAKKIFGNDIFQNSLDDKYEYKISLKIDGAPKTKTTSSTCAYTKGKLELNNSTNQPTTTDIKPAPEGNQNPVDPNAILDNLKKLNSQAANIPEYSAVITIHSTTQENAATDFNRSKPKSGQDVGGVGNSAFWNPEALGLSGKKQGSLSVLSGDKVIIVSGDNLDTDTAKKIVNSILDKL